MLLIQPGNHNSALPLPLRDGGAWEISSFCRMGKIEGKQKL
jgi:hypothetical protein